MLIKLQCLLQGVQIYQETQTRIQINGMTCLWCCDRNCQSQTLGGRRTETSYPDRAVREESLESHLLEESDSFLAKGKGLTFQGEADGFWRKDRFLSCKAGQRSSNGTSRTPTLEETVSEGTTLEASEEPCCDSTHSP